MKASKVGTTEAQLHALFLYESYSRGAFFQAYYPIVGVGMNAATLHYNKNNAPLRTETDLVLVDAGCELDCYASDITRCFPVGGKFSPEARVIYSIVLDMQKVRFKTTSECKMECIINHLYTFRLVLLLVRLALPGKKSTTLLAELHVMVF